MKNDIVDLKCIDITNEGQGVCKKDGLVVFVKEMLPDEEGQIKIIKEKKNLAYGIIDNLKVKSKYRIMPKCPISSKCGGCDFGYVDYGYQLQLKKNILESTFKNMNLDLKIKDVIAADNPNNYRNKVQIPVNNHLFGFYRNYSNDIVEFDECNCQSELSNKIFNTLKKIILDLKIDDYFRHLIIKHAKGSNEVMIGLVVKDFNISGIEELVKEVTNRYREIKSIILNLKERDDNVILGEKEKTIFGNNYIVDYALGLKFRISLKSFYQINYEQMHKLYDLILDLAKIDKDIKVLDLYCGIGTISLYLAKYAKEVFGVEIVKEAIINAKANAEINNINNAYFYLDDANNDMNKYLKDVDVVVLDPPRKGLNKQLIDSLINSGIKKIVYVSCNPATLARDLNYFKDYYDISDINPVDMFPYTKHVECVTILKLKRKTIN